MSFDTTRPALMQGKTWVFDTVADMVAESSMADGEFAETRGRDSVADGGAALYQIIKAADYSGNPDEAGDLTITGGAVVAQLVFGSRIRAEWFGTGEAAVNAGFAYAKALAKAESGFNSHFRLAYGGKADVENQIDMSDGGAQMRGLDVDFSNAEFTAVSGGNLDADTPLFKVMLADARIDLGYVYAGNICSGVLAEGITNSFLWTRGDNVLSDTSAYGLRVEGTATGNARVVENSWREWRPTDTEFATDANFKAKMLWLNCIDMFVDGGEYAWGGRGIYLDSGAANNTLSNVHAWTGRSGDPMVDPIIIESVATEPNWFQHCYFDNGYVDDYENNIQIDGGFHIVLPGFVTLNDPYYVRIYANGDGDPTGATIRNVRTTVGYLDDGSFSWNGDYSDINSNAANQIGQGVRPTALKTSYFLVPHDGLTDVQIWRKPGGAYKFVYFSGADATNDVVSQKVDPEANEVAWENTDELRVQNGSGDARLAGDELRVANPSVPATPTSPGKQGDIAWNATHFYWCHSDNNWLRVQGSTW